MKRVHAAAAAAAAAVAAIVHAREFHFCFLLFLIALQSTSMAYLQLLTANALFVKTMENE